MEWYAEKEKKYNDLKARVDETNAIIADKKKRAGMIKTYVDVLARQENVLAEFDEEVWCLVVDTLTVHEYPRLTFRFRDGREVGVSMKDCV